MMNRNKKATYQLIFLLLLTPLALLIAYYLLPELPSSTIQKQRFWSLKTNAKSIYDIVFIGDSRIYRGINTAIIEKENPGLKCFNFGFSSAGLDSTILNRAKSLLKKEGKQILVIGVSSNSFLPSSLLNEHWNTLKSESAKDRWIKSHVYPYLGAFEAYSFSGLYKISTGEMYCENFHSESGYVASSKWPADSNSALNAYREQFKREKTNVADILIFTNQIDDFRLAGIKVILLRMPVTRAMKRLEDEINLPNIDQMLNDLKIKGFNVLETQYPGLHTYDGSHLDSVSADLLSSKIAKTILK